VGAIFKKGIRVVQAVSSRSSSSHTSQLHHGPPINLPAGHINPFYAGFSSPSPGMGPSFGMQGNLGGLSPYQPHDLLVGQHSLPHDSNRSSPYRSSIGGAMHSARNYSRQYSCLHIPYVAMYYVEQATS